MFTYITPAQDVGSLTIALLQAAPDRLVDTIRY